MEWDPAVLWTKASGLFMPLLYDPNSLWISTVKAEEVRANTRSAASTEDFGAMTKDKLLDYAAENAISGINASMNKADILAVIKAAV